jgi:cytochrome c peroxidase
MSEPIPVAKRADSAGERYLAAREKSRGPPVPNPGSRSLDCRELPRLDALRDPRTREDPVKAAVAALVVSAGVVWGCGPGDGREPEVGQSAAPDPLFDQASALFSPIPDQPPELEENPITPAKVELGKMLYFEPRLSASWLISCNTCHNLGLGGVDLMETSIGHGWQKGPRNAPTVLNAVFNIAQFWDGRAEDLAAQAQGPVQAGVEMNNTPDRAVETLLSIPEYVEAFGAAFPGENDPVTFDNMAHAIEAFEATLITPDAPFDRFLRGDAVALTPEQREGLSTFIEKGCTSCHSGMNMGGTGYFPFGLVQRPNAEILPPGDQGRYAVTRTASDEYVFKAPTLRNVRLTPPYFHSGKVWGLNQAVGVMGTAQLGMELTPAEVEAIVAFLESLTGRQPDVEYPILPAQRPETPLPDVSVGEGTPT